MVEDQVSGADAEEVPDDEEVPDADASADPSVPGAGSAAPRPVLGPREAPPGTQRLRLGIEYDGTPFVGWQRQANGASVQAALEDSLAGLLRRPVFVQAAGRTDAGVHACGMVGHVDLTAAEYERLPPPRLLAAWNAHLRPALVAVTAVAPVLPQFHARFTARGRVYHYRILARRAPPVLTRGRVWHVPRALDLDAMRAAAAVLIGTHDFTSFRATACQALSPVKTLDRLEVARDGEEVRLELAARSFLHNQVRIIAGTLVEVGKRHWQPADVARALAARDRSAGGPTAPPEGLCLVAVAYD